MGRLLGCELSSLPALSNCIPPQSKVLNRRTNLNHQRAQKRESMLPTRRRSNCTRPWHRLDSHCIPACHDGGHEHARVRSVLFLLSALYTQPIHPASTKTPPFITNSSHALSSLPQALSRQNGSRHHTTQDHALLLLLLPLLLPQQQHHHHAATAVSASAASSGSGRSTQRPWSLISCTSASQACTCTAQHATPRSTTHEPSNQL